VTTLSERKLGFHSNHNIVTLFQKRTQHMAHSPLQRRRLQRRVASPAIVARYCCSTAAHRYCLHSSSTLKKNSRPTRKPTAQPACGAGHENQSVFCMRGGPTRSAFLRA